MKNAATFTRLVESIRAAHRELAAQAGKAINISLTLRNWLIGFYIAEYELSGKDRTEYGENLLPRLSMELQDAEVTSCGKRQLYGYLRFYQTYPQIVRSLPPQLRPADFEGISNAGDDSSQIVRSATAQSGIEPRQLIASLSYTHFEQLIAIDDATKRAFYEVECIRGNWSVRELKRQIGSLYYERSGLSRDKPRLAELTQRGAKPRPLFNIRDPYIFEFLGLKPAEVMSESHLEAQLTDKLQAFLLELPRKEEMQRFIDQQLREVME